MQMRDVDWALLARLRDRFLDDNPQGSGDYWHSEAELAHYDLTFAARIGWKWDAVLGDALARGWRPAPGLRVLDWGCGTGIATRRLLHAIGAEHFSGALAWDRSPRARAFAARCIQEAGLAAQESASGAPPAEPYLLLVSHVLNELSGLDEILRAVRGAQSVIWVEPGTPRASRELVAIREAVRNEFCLYAPCPHQARCGLAEGRRPDDWCHHFAPPPAEVFQNAEWDKFFRTLGIDRRALPTSYLVMSKPRAEITAEPRVLGRPRVYKGYAKLLVCRPDIVEEERLAKKEAPDTYRELDKPRFARYLLE